MMANRIPSFEHPDDDLLLGDGKYPSESAPSVPGELTPQQIAERYFKPRRHYLDIHRYGTKSWPEGDDGDVARCAAAIREALASSEQTIAELLQKVKGNYPWPVGDGDYSCASCGFGMKEPCVHWLRMNLSAAERERDELRSQLAALRIMLEATSWGAAYGAVIEDYPDLAEMVAAHDRQVRVKELREAATDTESLFGRWDGSARAAWLRARADKIAAEGKSGSDSTS